MRTVRRMIPVALVLGLAIPLIGCPIVLLKICVENGTGIDLVELNVSDTGSASWGPNLLATTVATGGTACAKGIQPGTYDVRAIFDGKYEECEKVHEKIFWESGTPFVFTSTNLLLGFLWDGCEIYLNKSEWFL